MINEVRSEEHETVEAGTSSTTIQRSVGQRRPTTTISTIVIKAGESTRLTLAVLKSGDSVQIRVDETRPSFLDVGRNLDEALTLQKQHRELREKLAAKISNVHELLAKADRLASERENPPDAELYAAMADSLGSAWRDLNIQLQLRNTLLDHAVKFYTTVSKHQEHMDQLEKYLQNLPTPQSTDDVSQIVKRHNQHRRDLLDTAVEAMTFGQVTIENIREIGSFVDNLERSREVVESCCIIEEIMMRINERRKKLELTWHDKQVDLEWSTQAAQVYAELRRIEEFLAQRKEFVKSSNLGDSEASAELMAKDNDQVLRECKTMSDAASRLTSVVDQLGSIGFEDGGVLAKRCASVKAEVDEFLNQLENRRQLLHMSVSFFRAASTALSRLDNLETQIKSLSLSRHKDVLARQHAELASRVQDTAQSALAQGRSLLTRVGSGAPGASGVERKLNELERRVAVVDDLCTAHKAEALVRSQTYQNFMQQYNSIHSWLVNTCESFLHTHRDMGTTLSTVNEFIESHRKLSTEIHMKETELVDFLSWAKGLELDEVDKEEVRKKCEDVKFRWEQVNRSVETRNRLAELYNDFHKQASQLATDMDKMEAIITTKREVVNVETTSQFEQMWSRSTRDCERLKQHGQLFLTENRTVVNDETLDVKSAQYCVETTLENFSRRHIATGRMWTEWQAKMKKDKEFREYWDKFYEQCRRVIHYVSELHDDASLAFKHFDQPPAVVAERQERALEEFRTKTQQTRKEIEEYLQTAEVIGSHGDTRGEKEKLVNELLEAHQQFQETVTQFEVLTSMTVTFFRNLHQIDEWIERVEERFQVDRMPKHDSGKMEQMMQEHRAASQTVEELVRFAQTESEQIVRRTRQPDVAAPIREECEKIPKLVEDRVKKWVKIYEDQLVQLEQHCTVSKFERQIIEVTEVVETLIQEIRQIKQSLGLSPQAVKVADEQFREMERKIVQTDKRVSSVVTTAESYISGPYRTSPKLQDRTEQLKQRWIDFRKEVEETQEAFTVAKTYWTLVEEIETWTTEITEYIVDVGRKTSQIKSTEEAMQLIDQIDIYVKPKREEQEQRIVKLEKAAQTLFGEDAVHKVDRHKRRYKEIVDTLHVVAEQVQTLKETLESTETKVKEMKELTYIPPMVQPQEPKFAPRFTQTLVDEEVVEGSKVELICKVAAQPKPIIKWYKDTLEIVNMPDYETTVTENVCTLKIEETFTEDSAIYTCRAINDVGTAETHARLTVKESKTDQMKAPEFIRQLTSTIVEESERTVMECEVIGEPMPTVSWYKNEKCIDTMPDYETTVTDGVCRLVIEETFLEDDAQYICRAVSPAGEAITVGKLTVKPKPGTHAPVIVNPLLNVTVHIGEEVILETTVHGQPVPEVGWLHNNRVIKETTEVLTTFDGQKAVLRIPETYPSHVGTYTIHARNRVGEASSSSVVQVRGKPSNLLETSDSEAFSDKEYKDSFRATPKGGPPVFVKQLPNLNVPLHTTRVKLDCVLIGNPRPHVTWLFNGQPIRTSLNVTIANVGDTYSIFIPVVTDEHFGTFSVVGENVYGSAKTSGTIEREDKPIVKPVIYTPGQPTSFITKTETEIVAEELLRSTRTLPGF